MRKFIIADGESACFQYIRPDDGCEEHFHLKCLECGRLIHLQCGYLSELGAHIRREHRFLINSSRTVFYGCCEDCLQKKQARQGRLGEPL